jgi:hypothetical protein
MIVVTATADWWRKLSRTVKVISYIGISSGAIVSTAAAWPIIEPYWVAQRYYVIDHSTPLLRRVIEIELKANDARRDRLLKEAPVRELELKSEQSMQTPQYRELVKDRLKNIKHELDAIDDQDKKLLKEKGQ